MNRVFAWPVGRDEGFETGSKVLWLFLGGTAVGGLLLGLTLAWFVGIAAAIHSTMRVILAIGIASLAIVYELRGEMGWWPEARRQVPRDRLREGRDRAATRFGVQLGFGLVTYIRHAAFYGLIALLAAVGSMQLALVAGVVFGLLRGVQPAVFRAIAPSVSQARRIESAIWSGRFDKTMRVVLSATMLLALYLTVIEQFY